MERSATSFSQKKLIFFGKKCIKFRKEVQRQFLPKFLDVLKLMTDKARKYIKLFVKAKAFQTLKKKMFTAKLRYCCLVRILPNEFMFYFWSARYRQCRMKVCKEKAIKIPICCKLYYNTINQELITWVVWMWLCRYYIKQKNTSHMNIQRFGQPFIINVVVNCENVEAFCGKTLPQWRFAISIRNQRVLIDEIHVHK